MKELASIFERAEERASDREARMREKKMKQEHHAHTSQSSLTDNATCLSRDQKCFQQPCELGFADS